MSHAGITEQLLDNRQADESKENMPRDSQHNPVRQDKPLIDQQQAGKTQAEWQCPAYKFAISVFPGSRRTKQLEEKHVPGDVTQNFEDLIGPGLIGPGLIGPGLVRFITCKFRGQPRPDSTDNDRSGKQLARQTATPAEQQQNRKKPVGDCSTKITV